MIAKPMPDELFDTLAALGATPTAVAHTLANKGARGVAGSPLHCVLAEYLHEQFPERDAPLLVSWTEPCEIRGEGIVITDGSREYRLRSAALNEFLRKFDAHDYPDLLIR